jgi:hypothetical protein
MPDKERVVRIKPERPRKGLSHIGADLTDAERKERAQKQLEQMQEMVDIAIAHWDKDNDERWNKWAKVLANAGGSVANLDRAELAGILSDAFKNFDHSTVKGIVKVIASDPELMEDFGLDQSVKSGWEQMSSKQAIDKLNISRGTLRNWKKDHPEWIKSDGRGWCLVSPECPRFPPKRSL